MTVFSIDRNGLIFVNRDEIGEEALTARVQEAIGAGDRQKIILFAGDPELSYPVAVEFLDKPRAAGAENVSLVADEIIVPEWWFQTSNPDYS